MVSFPANSPRFRDAEVLDEAVRLDAILPDVLRRYGLAPGPTVDRADRPSPGRELPNNRRRQIAEFRSEAGRS